MPSAAALELNDLSYAFTTRPAIQLLESFNLTIAPGDFVALLGPSGCGKSTLLHLLAGLAKPLRGEVRGIPQEPGKLSYVFQDAHLLPWLNVEENIKIPFKFLPRQSPQREAAQVQDVLTKVFLSDKRKLYPSQLSGGMKMRTSLARALVTQPELILLDEPFGALDEASREALDTEIRALWVEHKPTLVFVTHSISEAIYIANRIVVVGQKPLQILDDLRVPFGDKMRSPLLRRSPEFMVLYDQINKSLAKGHLQ